MDTTYQILNVASDTIYVAMKNSDIPATPGTSSSLKLLYGACATIAAAVLSALVTLRMKKTEFENFSKNLNLQKQLFEETKSNNESKIKAELVRLQDLRRQYQLSLKRFDFDHLKEVLEFADDKNEKASMLKDFATYLDDYNPQIPSYVIDHGEYQEYVVNHVYFKLENIQEELQKILVKYPSVFVSLHSDIKDVISEARYLGAQRDEILSEHDDFTPDEVINKLFDSFFSLHENLNGLLEKLQEEFKDLDRIKKEFIKSQVSKSL
jgi:DNA repair exonuclease SbcCD ATPase subunit